MPLNTRALIEQAREVLAEIGPLMWWANREILDGVVQRLAELEAQNSCAHSMLRRRAERLAELEAEIERLRAELTATKAGAMSLSRDAFYAGIEAGENDD